MKQFLKTRRIVQAELKKRGWTQEDLKKRREGDGGKLKVARIAQRLRMGTKTHLAHLLYWRK